ncbi:hypothetical protein MP478_10825 [Chryseobacterium sp. WG14]|uniref:hypothetical protein n=1 Tax=unclassified Chryseobacterium TaxID=2593645 RepID=UPI001DCB3359|nr:MULTISPECIES: hypothetical protein [unclassified Chryseobacterium]MCQ9636848.1 hypothetical protein [Chryseobacterium sp. WG23]MCQ9639877.1 hypothetical protein [Chryseobacterium sp. WG14]CAH0254829.1 hypothetical protein SRABI04_03327 [Chryseobacterium sp. Bi04]
MKKRVKLVSNLEHKSILKETIKSSGTEKMDLYKAVFGGIGIINPGTGIGTGTDNCNVAIEGGGGSAAYSKYDPFLRV